MAKEGTKLGLALLIVGAAAALAGAAQAQPQTMAARSGWVCNAYGYTGIRNQWQTVMGQREASQVTAKESAMDECRKKLKGCQSSGCWPGE